MSDPISLISVALSFLSQFGSVGHYISLVLGYIVLVPALITALVGLWHAVVAFLQALALVVPGLKGLADKFQLSQDSIDSKSNLLLNWLNRLSAIKLPAAKT